MGATGRRWEAGAVKNRRPKGKPPEIYWCIWLNLSKRAQSVMMLVLYYFLEFTSLFLGCVCIDLLPDKKELPLFRHLLFWLAGGGVLYSIRPGSFLMAKLC